ncbi:hypothetical protein H5410_047605 [Solanum commersonii]|uniref:Uncharacterized protein n=1 Tax=Solanum commersonii TaxID=4109 RepID=A0A9J5XFM3_SOLCO|nr:hypothetical protein H5410_047605 [Solanum commersonii]
MELCSSGGQWTEELLQIGCSMIFDALADHHITCDVEFSDLVWSLKKIVEEAVLHVFQLDQCYGYKVSLGNRQW